MTVSFVPQNERDRMQSTTPKRFKCGDTLIPLQISTYYIPTLSHFHFWNSSISESPFIDTTRYFLRTPAPPLRATHRHAMRVTMMKDSTMITRSFPVNAMVHDSVSSPFTSGAEEATCAEMWVMWPFVKGFITCSGMACAAAPQWPSQTSTSDSVWSSGQI